jgi:hypothetical protein
MNESNPRPIAEEIAELRRLTVGDLVIRFEETFGKPPRVKHRDHLWRKIAWRIQEQRLGGLSGAARKRLDELIAGLDVPELTPRATRAKVPVRATSSSGEPPVGTSLVRPWKGQEVIATRTDAGWECDGVVHRSLTAAAKAVTGTHWNGRLFFGLTKRKERP